MKQLEHEISRKDKIVGEVCI